MNVEIDDDAWRRVEGIAADTGRTPENILLDAIFYGVWAADVLKGGGKILAYCDGRYRELVAIRGKALGGAVR